MKIRIRGKSKKGTMLCKLTHNGFEQNLVNCPTNEIAKEARDYYNKHIATEKLSFKAKHNMLKTVVRNITYRVTYPNSKISRLFTE